jgi:hypothetical protein
MKTMDTPEHYLQEAYLGEIGGEATFRAIAELLPERASELHLLAEVERITAEYLSVHLLSPVPAEAVAERRAQGEKRVTAMGIDSWASLLDSAMPIVEDALATLKAAEADAPENLLEIYQTYTAHEQALADYMQLERDGRDGAHVLEDFINRVSAA